MHIEILSIVSYVGYFIIGIAIEFWTAITKSNSDKKARKFLWILGCVIAGCAGGLLVFFKIPKALILNVSAILIAIVTAVGSTLIEKVVRKEVK